MENQRALATKEDQELIAKEQEREVQEVGIKAEFDIATMVKSVGNVKLTEKQRKILFLEVPEEQVEIRADGIVYLPHIFYSGRLREAFGWEYAVIPKGDPKFIQEKNLIVWGFYMVIKGSLMAYAIGHQEYHPGKHMTYVDAMEGAKSNAIMRLCKDLGIGTELWKPEWRNDWQAKWAYIGRNDKGKTVWMKKRPNNGLNNATAFKSEEYIEVEKSIKTIMGESTFIGHVDLVDTETGEITNYDLDQQRTEILARLNSPTVFGIEIMKKIQTRCMKQKLAVIERDLGIEKEKEQVQVENGDSLGDEDMDIQQPSVSRETQGKGVDWDKVPEVMAPSEYGSDERQTQGLTVEEKRDTLFKDIEESIPDNGASTPQSGTKAKLPPRGEKLPPKKE